MFPQVLAGVRTVAGHGGIAFTQVRAFPEPTVLHPEPRRKCFAPSSDGIQNQSTARGSRFPPNHTRNASPQVLTGFRINQPHGGVAFPQTTPAMLCPKYWRDSESINGMGESLSPKYLDPPSKCFPQVLAELRTIQANHGSGHAGRGAAVSGMRGCGALRGKKYGVCQGE